jgi:DNA-binding MarR family transcriptional regulator
MDAALFDGLDEPDADEVIVAADPVHFTVKEKWQGAVTASSGFVAVPVSLLRLQTNLKLTATDMLVLINLLAHWWDPARSVFPRTTTIALRMGVTKRTVQRSMNKMIRRGIMERGFTDGRRTIQFTSLAERLARMIGISLAHKEVLDA